MVRYGYSRMMPFFDGLNELLNRNERIHITHDRMEMELHSRRGVIIFPFNRIALVGHQVIYI